jgi:hypothetical protein
MRAVLWATAASVALVAVYLALGGASYTPAAVADPCAPREWRNPGGFEEVAEQIVLSGLDGAACELGVSREETVLAFESRDSLREFARDQGVTDEELERIVRAALVRAIDDADDADALNSTVAGILRSLARRVPVDELLELLEQLPGF